jgi:hypothetical protein
VKGGLFLTQIEELTKFHERQIVGKVANVKVATKLDGHHCVITIEEMTAGGRKTFPQNSKPSVDRGESLCVVAASFLNQSKVSGSE